MKLILVYLHLRSCLSTIELILPPRNPLPEGFRSDFHCPFHQGAADHDLERCFSTVCISLIVLFTFRLCLFMNGDFNEMSIVCLNSFSSTMSMFMLLFTKKKILFCFLYQTCVLCKDWREDDDNEIPKLSNCMLSNKTLLTMYRHCFNSQTLET